MNCIKTLTLGPKPFRNRLHTLLTKKSANSSVSNKSHNLPKTKQTHILRFFNNSILVKLQYILEQLE